MTPMPPPQMLSTFPRQRRDLSKLSLPELSQWLQAETAEAWRAFDEYRRRFKD